MANNFFCNTLFFFRLSGRDEFINSISNKTSYIGTFIIICITFVLMFHMHVYQMKKWVELGMCM